MTFREKVGRDSARTFISGGVASVLAILTGIAIANALGPAGKGEYSGVRLLYDAVLSIVGGIGTAITYYLTRQAKPLQALAPSLLQVFVALCLILWAGTCAWMVFHGSNFSLVVFLFIVPASIIISWQPSIFVSYDHIRYLNYQTLILASITFVGTAITMWLLRTTIIGPIVAWAVGLYAIASLVVLFALRKLRTEAPSHERVPLRNLLGFSARSSLNNVLSFLNARIDSILVIAYVGVASFGIYSMATGVAELIFALSQAAATAMARSIGVSNFATSASVTAKAVRYNMIVVAAVSLVIFLFAPYLISKVYGGPFAPATLPLRILLPGLVLFSSTRMFNAFFTYQLGRPIFSIYLLLTVIVVQTVGCILFIPKLYLAGAALASLLAYLIATIGQAWYFCRISGIKPSTLWIPTLRDFAQLYDVALATARGR